MARTTYISPPSPGPSTALLVVTGTIGLISAIATIVTLVRSFNHSSACDCAEKANKPK